MGLFKLSTLALVAGVTASTGYGAPPAPVVVATDVLTVTSFVSEALGTKYSINL